MSNLQSARTEKDRFFASHQQSPLTPAQKHTFKGLHYFPETAGLRLEVEVEVFTTQDTINIQTTSGHPQTYRRYGKFKFMVDGQPAELTIYSGQHGFFLPFADTLAVSETYPAWRYLEPQKISGEKFRVDFNQAYNPYCAYNEQWSCPITPVENRLKVAIRAGEKIFQH
jgi:uncharacterized protein